MLEGLAHIGLFIRDIEASKKFYTEKLGFTVVSEAEVPDGTKIVMAELNDMMIEIVQLPEYDGGQDGVVNHIAIRVKDIEAAMKDLKEKGIQFETDKPVLLGNVLGGVRYAMFRGPDGERLEIDELL